ncbi:MAG: hypothetical protein MI975_14590 [Cytophagales bacterium]|nr:hypothetical protein [Cytophagales bacterium]
MMKKLSNYLLLTILGVLVFVTSCKDDDEDPKPVAPTVTVGKASYSAGHGQTIQMVFTIAAPGKIKSATPTVEGGGSATITNSSTLTGLTDGVALVEYTAPDEDASATVKISVTDDNDLSGEASSTVSVVNLAVTGPSDIMSIGKGATATIDFEISAPGIIKSVNVSTTLGSATVSNSGELLGQTSGTAKVEYTGSDLGTAVITLTVEDENDQDSEAVAAVIVKNTQTYAADDKDMFNDSDFVADVIYTLEKGEYMFDGLVYLENGGEINIPAGTVVRFKQAPTTGDPTSAFVITRGAKIFAEGSNTEPVIFTAEEDLNGSTPNLQPSENGKWGGLVILGSAPVMKKGNTLLQIEGISTSESRGQYGWGDAAFPQATPNQSSGVLKYVSIRYTGFALNGQPGDEIQGLTLGGVGAGTMIDYVESFSSDDDGIEIFGGTVDLKHFVVAYASDDSYDLDEGWRGKGQFLFALQGDGAVSKYDHAGEWDGAGNGTDDPFSAPNLVNCTFVGPGTTPVEVQHDRAILWREAFAGKVLNSIITDMPLLGLKITEDFGGGASPVSSCETIENERDGYKSEIWNTTFANMIKYDDSDIVSILDGECNDKMKAMLDANAVSATKDKVLENTDSRSENIDPRPKSTFSGAVKDPADLGLSGFDATDYQGAFKAGEDLWLKGWSTLSRYGYTVQ